MEFHMSEVLSPELFEQEGLSDEQFAEVLGDLSVSNVMAPKGDREQGYADDQPQGQKQYIGFVD